MPRKTTDPKDYRVTLRLSGGDVRFLRQEAKRQDASVGEVIRYCIRQRMGKAKRA